MFQKQEKVLLISDKTLKEIRTAYRDYLKHMDIYEKDEWLRSTVLINVIPILSRNEEDLEEDSDKITFSTEEINQVISKAILKNRVKLLNKQELQDLENMLKKFKPKKDDPDILMPESKLSLFHVDLTKRPLLSLAAILTPPITCAMLIFSYFKYFRQPEETENNLLTTQDELVLLPLISGVVFSSKLTVDALRWCHEKFLPEVPARPYLPSRGENQQEGKKDTNVAVVPQSKMRLT